MDGGLLMPKGMIPGSALDPFIDAVQRLEAKVERLERHKNDLMSVLTDIMCECRSKFPDVCCDSEEALSALLEIADRMIRER